MEFRVDEKLFEHFLDYCVGIVVAKGIDNRQQNPKISAFLESQIREFQEGYTGSDVRELPFVKAYREAFRGLGINPNRFMCSIEALLKRIQKQGQLPSVNPVVDIGNAFSVKHQLPLGAHDIDKMPADFQLRFSLPEDRFLPMGEEAAEVPETGELVYVSGHTVKTRRWMWRQSEDGKITEQSANIFFPVDGFTGINEKEVLLLTERLAEFLQENCSCQTIRGFVEKQRPSFRF